VPFSAQSSYWRGYYFYPLYLQVKKLKLMILKSLSNNPQLIRGRVKIKNQPASRAPALNSKAMPALLQFLDLDQQRTH